LPAGVRLDPRFDALLAQDATLEKVADDIAWAEGPVWSRFGNYLLFSDVPNNAILKWKEGEGLTVLLKPSGYTGAEPFSAASPGRRASFWREKGSRVSARRGTAGPGPGPSSVLKLLEPATAADCRTFGVSGTGRFRRAGISKTCANEDWAATPQMNDAPTAMI